MKLTPLDPWIQRKIATGRPILTRQELEAWQLWNINQTLSRVQDRSSFYRKAFEGLPRSIRGLDELHQFPFTFPEDIRQNPLQFVCVSQDEIHRVVTLQSSGTTGEPKRIFFTEDDQELTIDFFGVGMSTLTEPGERVLILLPCKIPGGVGDLLRLGLARLGRIPIPYGPVGDPFHVLETMQSRRVDCLAGSPTQVLGLARRWNPKHKAPRTVLLSTDYVPAAIVQVLEETWRCDVFNHYGATEMGLGGGVECETRLGYHLREADLYFEVVHPKTGEPLPEGEYGEVVFSTLTRHGMPLVRYRTGDRSRFLTGLCPCGTTLRTLEKVSGRFDGLIPVLGETLSLPDFDEALFPIPDLVDFSVTLAGEGAGVSVIVETQMLSDVDATHRVEKALAAIPSIKNLEIMIRCRYNPKETGSLQKRAIIDRRG